MHNHGSRDYLAKWVLDATEQWASGYMMIRETGIVFVGRIENEHATPGRLDALLVPVSPKAPCMIPTKEYFWYRCGLIGVEVKVSRDDFLRGLREKQYQRYNDALSGLYVAAPRGVLKTAELPEGVGHLVYVQEPRHNSRIICKRHPAFKKAKLDPDVPWRIVFEIAEQYRKKQHKERRDRKSASARFAEVVSRRMNKLLNQIEDEVATTGPTVEQELFN